MILPNKFKEMLPKYLKNCNLKKIDKKYNNVIDYLMYETDKKYKTFYIFMDSENVHERGILFKIQKKMNSHYYEIILIKHGSNDYHKKFTVEYNYFKLYFNRYDTYFLEIGNKLILSYIII